MADSILLHVKSETEKVESTLFPITNDLTIKELSQVVNEEMPHVKRLKVANKGRHFLAQHY